MFLFAPHAFNMTCECHLLFFFMSVRNYNCLFFYSKHKYQLGGLCLKKVNSQQQKYEYRNWATWCFSYRGIAKNHPELTLPWKNLHEKLENDKKSQREMWKEDPEWFKSKSVIGYEKKKNLLV